MTSNYKILITFLVLTNLVTGYLLFASIPRDKPAAENKPENEPVELMAGGTVPKSWRVGVNESPQVLKNLTNRNSSNSWQIVNAEGGICFSGGCDLPNIAVHIVDYQDVKAFLDKAANNPTEMKDLGYSYGNSFANENIDGEAIPTLTNNNNEDKYPGMKTYFLLGRGGDSNSVANRVYYVVTSNGNTVEKNVISDFISSINLDVLPLQAP